MTMTDGLTPKPPGRVRGRPFEQSRRPAARLVVNTFVQAIETSDFELRLRLVEADHFDDPGTAAGINGADANGTTTTHRRILAANLLQIAGPEIIGSIDDCG